MSSQFPTSSHYASSPSTTASQQRSSIPTTLNNNTTLSDFTLVQLAVRGSDSTTEQSSERSSIHSTAVQSRSVSDSNAGQQDMDDDTLVTVVVTPRRVRNNQADVAIVRAQNQPSNSAQPTIVQATTITDTTKSTLATDHQTVSNTVQSTTAPSTSSSRDGAKRVLQRPPALKPLVRQHATTPVKAVTVIDLTKPISNIVNGNDPADDDFPSYSSNPPRLTPALKAEYAIYEQLALTQYAALEPSWHKQLDELRRTASPIRSGGTPQLRTTFRFPVFGKLPKATCSRVGYRYQATDIPDLLTDEQREDDQDELVHSLVIEGYTHKLTADDLLLPPSFPIPVEFIPRKRAKINSLSTADEPVAQKKIGRVPTELLTETAIRSEMNRIRTTEGAQVATRARAVKNLRDRHEDIVTAPVDERRASRRSTQISSIASKQQHVSPSPSRQSTPVKPEIARRTSNSTSSASKSLFVTHLDDLMLTAPASYSSTSTSKDDNKSTVKLPVDPRWPVLAKLSRKPSISSDATTATTPVATIPAVRYEVPPLPDPSLFADMHKTNDDVPHRLKEYLKSWILSLSKSSSAHIT